MRASNVPDRVVLGWPATSACRISRFASRLAIIAL